MANQIRLKRASGSDPTASDLVLGEPAVRTDTGELFFLKDNGNVAKVSGGGGVEDGDKGDITVSNSGDTFTIDNGVITSAKIADGAIALADMGASSVGTSQLVAGAVNNDKVASDAAIAGSKISPTFTSNITLASTTNGQALIITKNGTQAAKLGHIGSGNEGLLVLKDGGTDTVLLNGESGGSASYINSGNFAIGKTTASEKLDVVGNIAVSGTVDGVDIAARNTLFGGLTSSSGVLTNGVTATTQSASDNSTKVATTAYTDTAISNLVDSAPGTLNTLNELAAALGDDANFSTTVTNSIATKMPLAGGTFTGDVTFQSNSGNIIFDKSDNALEFSDNNKAKFGGSADLEIYHDGSNSYLDNSTGDFFIRNNSNAIKIRPKNDEESIVAHENGAVELFFNNTKRIETNNTGAFVTGELGCDTLYMGDNEKAKFGNNDDLQIYHSGSDSFIDETGTGDLKIRTTNGGGIQLISGTSENMITCAKDGSVELYEDGTKRIETTTSGANIVGNLTLSGTVDGRDVASDGSKLDGIESGATADQSASEILTLIKTVDGSGSGLDADTLDGISSGSFVRSDADDTMAANLTIDNGTSTTLSVKCDNSGLALIRANGDGQGTGAVEVGQANTYGGGIAYNGDGSPSFADGESADHIIFYRLDNGTRTEVFHYPYNGNTVNFNSTPTVGGVSLVKTNDTIAQATNASTLDSIDSSSFVRSDTDDTLAGIYTLTNTNRDCFNFSGSASDDNRGIAFNGRIALSADQNDGWLRLNNASEFGSGVYTPGIIRADNGFRVDSTTVIDGSGNIAYARLTGTPTIPTNNNQLTNGAGYITSASFSDVAGGGTFTGDIALSGGAAAMTVNAGSDIRFTSGDWTGNSCKIQHHNSILYIVGGNSGIIFRESGTDRAKIDGSGHFCPATDNTYTLGTSSLRWQDVYTNDLNLSNEGSSNKVDNTWGDYTIQEGADDLFIINNRNGKMFKFMLQEVK